LHKRLHCSKNTLGGADGNDDFALGIELTAKERAIDVGQRIDEDSQRNEE